MSDGNLGDGRPTICAQSVEGYTVLDFCALPDRRRRLRAPTKNLCLVADRINKVQPFNRLPISARNESILNVLDYMMTNGIQLEFKEDQ